VKTDAEKMYAIQLNLIKNAIKFTKKGSIEFGFSKNVNQLKFYVKDSGIGIPKEEIEKLLQLESDFKRLGTAQEVGTGLGLVLSSEFIKLMNGELKIESEEHKGSQFSFTFPTV